MRILFLCNKSPWPPREGGPMAMNMFIEGLICQGHEVKVLAVNSDKYNITLSQIPESYRRSTGIELIDVDLRVKLLPALLNLFTSSSYHVQRFISPAFRQRLTDVLKQESFDIVQLETLFMCPYIPEIHQHSTARIILRAHNIEHRIWQRIASTCRNPVKRWYLKHLSDMLESYEKSSILETDGVVPITENDATWFRANLPDRIPVKAIPFGLNPDLYQPDPEKVDFPSLFSIGSMNWIPNQEGIRWFLREVWPDVYRLYPDIHYYIAGREMPDWMKNITMPNVHVVGEVDDARKFIGSYAIMIVPLFSGSGIRIKIIEGMAAGKTVISTTLGAEGINCTSHENILVANLPCEFFEMISISINDRQLCERIGRNARKLVIDQYNPDDLIAGLTGFYYFCRSKNDA